MVKQWIDEHPDYLLILGDDHGHDETCMPGFFIYLLFFLVASPHSLCRQTCKWKERLANPRRSNEEQHWLVDILQSAPTAIDAGHL
jgi:hypothetical protein